MTLQYEKTERHEYLAPDVSGLLEVERGRNAVLVAALSSAKDERERAQTEAAASKKRILHLEKQLQMTHSAGVLSHHLHPCNAFAKDTSDSQYMY